MGEIPEDFDENEFVNKLIWHQMATGSLTALFTAAQAEFLRGLCQMLERPDAFDSLLLSWVNAGRVSVLQTGDVVLADERETISVDELRRRASE